jgi:hypothetical protein
MRRRQERSLPSKRGLSSNVGDERREMRDERCEMQGVGVTRTRKWGAAKPVALSTHDLGVLPCAIFPLNGERPRERQALIDGPPPDHVPGNLPRYSVNSTPKTPPLGVFRTVCLRATLDYRSWPEGITRWI